MWHEYFDKIYLINLPHRTDRLERETAILNEYEIPFKVFEAIPHEKGYFGLVLTMKALFGMCVGNGYEKILVFEDDFKPVEFKESFNNIMEKCIADLSKLNWGTFQLGLQHPKPFRRFETPNILPVDMGYSTHAVAYNTHAMKFFLERYIDEPIDNFFVREYQPMRMSFCSYPLLATQFAGHSDIGGQYIDWGIYIEPTFQKFTRHLFGR